MDKDSSIVLDYPKDRLKMEISSIGGAKDDDIQILLSNASKLGKKIKETAEKIKIPGIIDDNQGITYPEPEKNPTAWRNFLENLGLHKLDVIKLHHNKSSTEASIILDNKTITLEKLARIINAIEAIEGQNISAKEWEGLIKQLGIEDIKKFGIAEDSLKSPPALGYFLTIPGQNGLVDISLTVEPSVLKRKTCVKVQKAAGCGKTFAEMNQSLLELQTAQKQVIAHLKKHLQLDLEHAADQQQDNLDEFNTRQNVIYVDGSVAETIKALATAKDGSKNLIPAIYATQTIQQQLVGQGTVAPQEREGGITGATAAR
jgi:hypothetical protein